MEGRRVTSSLAGPSRRGGSARLSDKCLALIHTSTGAAGYRVWRAELCPCAGDAAVIGGVVGVVEGEGVREGGEVLEIVAYFVRSPQTVETVCVCV